MDVTLRYVELPMSTNENCLNSSFLKTGPKSTWTYEAIRMCNCHNTKQDWASKNRGLFCLDISICLQRGKMVKYAQIIF